MKKKKRWGFAFLGWFYFFLGGYIVVDFVYVFVVLAFEIVSLEF